MPPNGRSGVVQVGWLTNTMPASMRLATRLPRAISLVKTDPPNPKSESLASATASSSLLTRNRSATGPKSSSRYAGLPGLMFARIVGCMNDPGRSIRLPHATQVAPSARARLSSSGGNQSSRFDAARQRDALDPGIVDHLSDLVMRDQQVGVRTHRSTRFKPQLLKSDGALRNTPCVLHHDDIARHQVGRGKTRELVVGKVPRLDAEQHAERATFDLSFARTRLEVLWCEEALGVLGIVVEDVRAEHHLAPGLGDELTHLERHGASKLVDAGAHDSGGLCDHGRPPGESRVPPVLEAGRCVSKRRLKLVVGEFLERFQNLPVIWVNALVSHRVCPLLNPTLLVTLAGIAPTQTPGMKTRARVICRPISSQFG